MKTLLLKQTGGFTLMTEDAWKRHLVMVKMNLLQEEPEDADEVLEDYANSFEKIELSKKESQHYELNFGITTNTTRKIDSKFGTIIHF